jgi:hypothetical protein
MLPRCLALLLPLAVFAQAETLRVTVSHDLAIARPAETISVPWSEVNGALPGALLQKLVVRDATGRSLPYQVTNIAPTAKDPKNTGVAYGELIFQHDFAVGEKSATFTVEKTETVAPPFPVKADARAVPERLDDFAWENDRIAHRIYGPALAAPAPAGVTKEVLVASGIDVWAKRVDYPIIDRWYNKGHDHYHHDEGEGMDFFGVATSRGCGGTGIWSDGRLYVSSNYVRARVLSNGPVRAVFEIDYDTWSAGGRFVSETKRFTVDAGRNLTSVESTFAATGKSPALTVAIGLTKTPMSPKHVTRQAVTPDAGHAVLAQWTESDAYDSVGTAVVVVDPASFAGFAEDEANQLLLVQATAGQPVRYLIGAGWTRSGQFADQAAWQSYVTDEAARRRSPVTVTFSTP